MGLETLPSVSWKGDCAWGIRGLYEFRLMGGSRFLGNRVVFSPMISLLLVSPSQPFHPFFLGGYVIITAVRDNLSQPCASRGPVLSSPGCSGCRSPCLLHPVDLSFQSTNLLPIPDSHGMHPADGDPRVGLEYPVTSPVHHGSNPLPDRTWGHSDSLGTGLGRLSLRSIPEYGLTRNIQSHNPVVIAS